MSLPLGALLAGAALAGYAASAALYLLYPVRRRAGLAALALCLLSAGWLAHTLAMVAWTVEGGHLPIASIPETLGLYAWLLAATAIGVHRRLEQPVYGTGLAPIAAVAMALGGWLDRGPSTLAPILASGWLPLHVLTSFVAYALLTLASAAAVLHLVALGRLKRKSAAVLDGLIPPLSTTDQLAYRLMVIGFPMLTLTLLTGALWSAQTWGSPWRWDPKETMALATWCLWAVFFVARWGGWRGRRAAWLVVAGFLSTLVLFLGIGLAAPGLHDFGA